MKVKIISLVVVVLALFGINVVSNDIHVGSVDQGSEYHSTTTSTGRFTVPYTLQTGNGALGSVVITGAATGVINIYDATTTNSSLRSSDQASSSILLATFPASTAANTYTFDALFYRGLIYDVVGVQPTTTVTWR